MQEMCKSVVIVLLTKWTERGQQKSDHEYKWNTGKH